MHRKLTSFLLLLSLFLGSPLFSQIAKDTSRHLIIENKRYGFINANGEKTIAPIFHSAYPFSEGLAAVRSDKGSGFINIHGEFIIPPIYDYTTPFKNGMARVYHDEIPLFINKSGTLVFDSSPYQDIGTFKMSCAIVTTESGKKGLINLKGELIADTAFSKIDYFEDESTRAFGLEHNPMGRNEDLPEMMQCTLLDTNGQMLIDYEKRYIISKYENGYFEAQIMEKTQASNALLNLKGEILFSLPKSTGISINEAMPEGVVTVYFYKKWDSKTNTFGEEVKNAQGFLHLDGTIGLYLEDVSFISDFHQNRSFISMRNGPYKIVDPQLNILPIDSIRIYRTVSSPTCLAEVIKTGENDWFYIDSMGLEIDYTPISKKTPNSDYLILSDIIEKEEDTYDYYYLADLDSNRISSTYFDDYNANGFYRGLLLCELEGKQFYLNSKGQTIWEESDNESLSGINIDYKSRASFYAKSKSHSTDIGGFGGSKNTPQKVHNDLPKDGLCIYVDTINPITNSNQYLGYTIYLINNLDKEVLFSASDSRLYMLLQAQDTDGRWKDIEYLPESWCGNSFHTLTLDSNEYWQFKIPIYEGNTPSKCRVKLFNYSIEKKKQDVIYSDEFEIHVNSTQFWRKRWYVNQGIMDPYFD